MPRRKKDVPSLLRHAGKGLGYVKLNGRTVYLGAWPDDHASPPVEVRERYDRAIAEWLQRGRQPVPPRTPNGTPNPEPDGLTTGELIARYWAYAEGYYRRPEGGGTSELDNVRLALRPLNHAYGRTPAAAFGPLALKAYRRLLAAGYDHPEHGPQPAVCRKEVNRRAGIVVRAFAWAVSEEIVPGGVLHALKAVKGLRAGRGEARETQPVRPADPADVGRTLPFVRPPVAAMVRLQSLTGCRPGEACGLTLGQLDRSGEVWLYRPASHKNAWRGKTRVIAVGPKARDVLREFIRIRCTGCGVEGRPPRLDSPDGALCGECAARADGRGVCGPWPRVEAQPPDVYLFSPAADREERFEDLRAGRKSKVQPSQACRKKGRPRRAPGGRYTTTAYNGAVARACDRAGVPRWHVNRLRHLHATAVRRAFGLEAAACALGHARADVTQIYAERDVGLAVRVARELG